MIFALILHIISSHFAFGYLEIWICFSCCRALMVWNCCISSGGYTFTYFSVINAILCCVFLSPKFVANNQMRQLYTPKFTFYLISSDLVVALELNSASVLSRIFSFSFTFSSCVFFVRKPSILCIGCVNER